MASVTLQNKTFGVLLLGIKNEQNASVVDTLRIRAREQLAGLDPSRLTVYTQGLIRKGLISIKTELE